MKEKDPSAFVSRLGARVVHLPAEAMPFPGTLGMYCVPFDIVFSLPKGDWKNTDGYWQTLFHELIHWTGHRRRLNRPALKPDSVELIIEELAAEMGSAALNVRFGMEPVWEIIDANCAHWVEGIDRETQLKYLGIARKMSLEAIQFLVQKGGEDNAANPVAAAGLAA